MFRLSCYVSALLQIARELVVGVGARCTAPHVSAEPEAT